jgi:type IV conjugative transfer system pilin TraA
MLTAVNRISIASYVKAKDTFSFLTLGVFLMMLMAGEGHADGVNHLATLKPDISATFGGTSDVPFYLYMAEAIGAGMAYIKTKNIVMLAGLPILMVFTHWALK